MIAGERLRGPEWYMCKCGHKRNTHWSDIGCEHCGCDTFQRGADAKAWGPMDGA